MIAYTNEYHFNYLLISNLSENQLKLGNIFLFKTRADSYY